VWLSYHTYPLSLTPERLLLLNSPWAWRPLWGIAFCCILPSRGSMPQPDFLEYNSSFFQIVRTNSMVRLSREKFADFILRKNILLPVSANCCYPGWLSMENKTRLDNKTYSRECAQDSCFYDWYLPVWTMTTQLNNCRHIIPCTHDHGTVLKSASTKWFCRYIPLESPRCLGRNCLAGQKPQNWQLAGLEDSTGWDGHRGENWIRPHPPLLSVALQKKKRPWNDS
jgi:hypothetical protein